ncbi:myeloid differentiation primary response protein MyD88 [Diorhabda sublineata]|uniref:myeloid differentiation primary response protein MyD88 n=1 Tax=Diorhabda sublineata TaxID=1163346 RepID=UPI0024E16208|nr:myeloid differentiation primary response protein MyD88 [Diorhabda sublineata]XP_056649208.1 myeloid differentiation primary response protein MyD88 [Diorhabda sublineata]
MTNIPIRCLRKETRDLISALLNPKKIIPNETGLSRDWYGLAELCGIGGEKIPNIERNNDPTKKVLELWSEKNGDESTTAKLISYLETLDRFDVIDDVKLLIEEDAEYYTQHPEGFTVSRVEIDDKDIITFDDYERKTAGLPPQTYDAFVLFDDDDIGFATDIIQTLEGQYSLKLCVKDRDVLGGESNYDSVIRLISTRCNRVVVVVSPSFLGSPSNKYFYTLAQMDGIEREERKIIPCIYKDYPDMPLQIKAYHVLNYTRLQSAFGNFWEQLYKSVKVAKTSSTKSNMISQKETKEVPKKTTESMKLSNHVKFDSEQTKHIETKLSTVEIPISSPPIPSSNEKLETCQKELKKKNSLYQKFRKILNQKTDKQKSVEEVPTINGTMKKKKRFFKSNKLKIAVAN